MRCPTCDVMLITEHRLDVEIDICPSCRGIWLDRGELNQILDRADGRELPESADERLDVVGSGAGLDRAPAGRRAEPSYWMTVLHAD